MALVITILSGVILGSIASFLTQLIPFVSILVVLFPIASGVLISRILRRVVPRKHGITLKVAVGLGVVVSFLALGLGDFILHDPVGLLEPGVATFLVHNWLLNFVVNPFALLFLALGVYVGVNQLD